MAGNDQEYRTGPLLGRLDRYGLYLLVDDVDGLYGRAIAAGGRSVFPPEDTEWGTRRARVARPGGLEWELRDL